MTDTPGVGDVIESPPDTLETALSVAKHAGWPIFPVQITKAERGTDKKPLTAFTEKASTDPDRIRSWWRKHPFAWVGVYAGGADLLIVDVDVPKGDDERDGRVNLRAAGLRMPKTLTYSTPSGGRHHVFTAPPGVDLTITKDDPVPGVDIRAGNGLCVYYGPALTGPPDVDAAPDWAAEAAKREGRTYARSGHADLDEWLDRLDDGKPSKALRRILEDVTDEGMGHDDVLTTTTALVKHQSERGARTAWEQARATYTANYPDFARHWDEATRGSVEALGMPLRRVMLTKPERKAIARRHREVVKRREATIAKGDDDADSSGDDLVARYGATPAKHPAAGRRELTDGPISEEIAARLGDRWAYSTTLGLIRYRGKVWEAQPDSKVFTEHVRRAIRAICHVEAAWATQRGQDKRLAECAVLLQRAKVRSVTATCEGIYANAAVQTDAHPDLLNTPSGVVDLRTGELREHDPKLYLTKIAGVAYEPGATFEPWSKAIESIPKSVRPWVQVRMGQAATGYTPEDAVMPLFEGSGQNAKSTVLDAIRAVLGGYAVTVSDRLLLANPGDHPTELTQLMGARLAVVEELPEGRNLNVKRLKDVMGTETLTARRISENNVTWRATHSLALSTNYRPIVNETDHGTWRRLALVRFPYRYLDPGEPLVSKTDRRADTSIREAVKSGHPAVLAWIVEGAMQWYANGKQMPQKPQAIIDDTLDWRRDADPVLAYVDERLELDSGFGIPLNDLLLDFNSYLEQRSQRPWSEQTIAQRFADHVSLPNVKKRRVTWGKSITPSRSLRSLSSMLPTSQAFVGVRFKLAPTQAPVVPPSAEVRGWQEISEIGS